MVTKKGVSDEQSNYVKWLYELSKDSVNEVGGKGANLAEMYNNKLPVPPAFVITASAYKEFLKVTGLESEIYQRLGRLDNERTAELEETAKKIREMIEDKEIPKTIAEEILESYEHLSVDEESLKGASKDALSILRRSREPIFVAVRSSATAEDSEGASFAGQQATFINVKGNNELLKAVKGCWASLYTARSVYYRIKKGFKHEEMAIAVVVQKMIDSQKSGVIFTKDPRGISDNVIIEAVLGQGEGIVSGMIAPDHYVVGRNLEIISIKVSDKKIALVRNAAGNTEKVKLTDERSKSQVLSNYEIKKLAQYALGVEDHYKKPQDLEFSIEAQEIYIVQTRPITTLGIKDFRGAEVEQELENSNKKVLIEGLGASPGVASGTVKIIHDLNELDKIGKGDVLVTEMTNPDMVVAMQKATAIVTDEGGLTAHAAIVSREMGIPAIVGTRMATTTLKEGTTITVDGFNGKVYDGVVEGKKVVIKPIIKGTRTKIKVILDLPQYADRAAMTEIESVGLTRIEGIIAESGKHPNYYLHEGRINDYEEVIYQGIKKLSEKFKEVWVRTSDLRSDEYKNLEGAPKNVEANPMLGMHGIRAGLRDKEILLAEIKALMRVAEEGKTIGIMTPQVISVEEVRGLKEMMKEAGVDYNNDNGRIRLGIMIETPAATQIINELCDEGIRFISFGTNDLTQYTLAVDRGNEAVQGLYNEMHPAVLKQLSEVIKVCRKRNVESSICGQAGSNKEMVKFLVMEGIDSISVNADKAWEISEYVKELEEGKVSPETAKDEQENNNEKEAFEEPSEKEELVSDAYVRNSEDPISEHPEVKAPETNNGYDEEILRELNNPKESVMAVPGTMPDDKEQLLDIF